MYAERVSRWLAVGWSIATGTLGESTSLARLSQTLGDLDVHGICGPGHPVEACELSAALKLISSEKRSHNAKGNNLAVAGREREGPAAADAISVSSPFPIPHASQFSPPLLSLSNSHLPTLSVAPRWEREEEETRWAGAGEWHRVAGRQGPLPSIAVLALSPLPGRRVHSTCGGGGGGGGEMRIVRSSCLYCPFFDICRSPRSPYRLVRRRRRLRPQSAPCRLPCCLPPSSFLLSLP